MGDQDNGKNDEPDDFTGIVNNLGMTPLDAMAVQLNEVYESLTRAGFSPTQAITMVTGLLSGMLQYVPTGAMLDEFDDRDDRGYNDKYDNDEDDNDDWDEPEDFY